MDGPAEHSDSDSGESWTILEDRPLLADDVPESPVHTSNYGDVTKNIEKDEDTDGISIISDSDTEMPPEHVTFEHLTEYKDCPAEQNIIPVSAPTPSDSHEPNKESIRAEHEFLGDNTKLRTYVHRRNKRLSTVLNIIVLGSVITAAGVAIGHMWGVRDDCALHTAPSVNKILSNLYKLQEENSYLRNKIKELTQLNNIHMQQKKFDIEKHKNTKCRKVFEEALSNRNVDKFTKCVDDPAIRHAPNDHLLQPEFEKEFINDLNKLKNVYRQNRSWLDENIARRLKNEEQTANDMKTKYKVTKDRVTKEHKNKSMTKVTPELQNRPIKIELLDENSNEQKKISYADSLKSIPSGKRKSKREAELVNTFKDIERKKKLKKSCDAIPEKSISEFELGKDDRYTGHKQRVERKKYDRKKTNKKQKRQNKYEQWEMKGGYMKDYDDFSITSAQENEFTLKNPDKNFLSQDFEKEHYMELFSETDGTKAATDGTQNGKHDKKKKNKAKDASWYEMRATLRNEARKKLEQEMFGSNSSNNAGWYFRRMQKREQFRTKGDNSTHKKLMKRNMNYKMKH